MSGRLRFDRNELAGSFGDIGTDLPLLVGVIQASGLDAAGVFAVFGLCQIATGFLYGLPMPVQPLKAMAALVIAGKLAPSVIRGAGMSIGLVMLALASTGLLGWLARSIPKPVVRGIQFGLGMSLASLALKDYVRSDGALGYALAGAGFVLALALKGNRRYPAALFVIGLGALYSLLFKLDLRAMAAGTGWTPPGLSAPKAADLWIGFVALALPQLPLSLSNSVIATERTVRDLFPDRAVSVRKIGLTYSFMNLLSACLGGFPVCHGAGGMAGHYGFGARTGGSVVLYGGMYLVLGLFLGGAVSHAVRIFPLPILGVVLFFEGLALMLFLQDLSGSAEDLALAMLVGLLCMLPQGYVVGLLVGAALYALESAARSHRADRP